MGKECLFQFAKQNNPAMQLWLLLLSFFYFCNGSERDVFLHIFQNYDRRIRPVRYTSTTTTVGVQMQIISLLEVNSQQEYIKLALFFKEIWQDEFLSWNPADFNGTEYIRAPVTMTWLPDFSIVTTSLQSEDFIPKDEQVLGIRYSGDIDYSFPFVLTNYCPMQSDKFPFDSQTCIIKVTSWKYTSKFVFLEHTAMNNTSARNPSTEWEILPYTNLSVDFAREGVGEDGVYRQVHYYVTLKRKSTYYIWVIIVPTFIITALSIAGIFSPFSSTGDREEKTTLGLTTLLTLAIILSLVTEAMPKATKLPILGLYILMELIICTICMALSVAILFLHQRATTRNYQVPSWLDKILCGERCSQVSALIQLSIPNNPTVRLVLLFLSCFCFCDGSERDVHVFLKIFENYDPRIRPVHNTSTTTIVGVQMQIFSLLEVNSEQEYISLALFFREAWNDEFVTWNPDDFDGTEYIRAPATMLWLPDFSIVATSLQSADFISKDEQMVGIHYYGDVDYSFPFVLYNSCPMQSDEFPFDSQTCAINVTSWKYTSKFLYYEHVPMNNTGSRNPNTEWKILPYTNLSLDFAREGMGEDGVYRQIHYYLTLKRKSAYYVWVIIVPTFIITALSIAGIFSPFSNTGDREERTTLGLTTLLTLAIILSLVTEAMPKGMKLPILGIYILMELIICTVCMTLSVIILVLHQRTTTRNYQCSAVQKDCNKSGARKQVTEKSDSFDIKFNDTLSAIRRWLQKQEEEEALREHWLIIFDRIDSICLVLFQIINIINFAVFMK